MADAKFLLDIDVDDTPVDAATTNPISSNWAYDHVDAADPHPGYVLESAYGEKVTVVSGSLTAGAQNAKVFSWQNTSASASILVHKVLINITTGSTLAAQLNVGQAATEIESDNLIDGVLLNAVDVLNNFEDKGTNGSCAILVADDQWVTGFEDDTAASTDLVGKYYIFYTGV